MVCARCSDYKAELQYDGNRLNRVCQECYIFLTGHVVLEDREEKHKGILEVSAARPPRALLLCPSSSELCHPRRSPALLSQLGHVPAAGGVGVAAAAVRGCLRIARPVDVLSPLRPTP